MVPYGRISTKVWRSVGGLDSAVPEIKEDELGYLDYQVQRWQLTIPPQLVFQPSDNSVDHGGLSQAMRRLRITLYLRVNQMRILIFRPVLQSATNIMEYRGYAQRAVEVAKDTIRVLTALNQTSDIYRTQQVCFNYFLVSALAVLFLAVSHTPVEFNRQVRDEFYMALDLVKGFSTKSYISQRLWKTIRGLKEIGPKLGLVSRQALPEENDPHSSAAVAMAGLAGHRMDELTIPIQEQSPLGSTPIDGQQMSNELTTLFEAMGSYGSILASDGSVDGMNGFVGTSGDLPTGSEGIPAMYGNELAFTRIMRDCF